MCIKYSYMNFYHNTDLKLNSPYLKMIYFFVAFYIV